MSREWTAKWIGMENGDDFHPVIFKDFYIDEQIKKATLFITAIGLFEVYVNGQRVGDEYLMPAKDFDGEGIPYLTFDVTELLHCGPESEANSVDVFLGNAAEKAERFALKAEFEIEVYKDEAAAPVAAVEAADEMSDAEALTEETAEAEETEGTDAAVEAEAAEEETVEAEDAAEEEDTDVVEDTGFLDELLGDGDDLVLETPADAGDELVPEAPVVSDEEPVMETPVVSAENVIPDEEIFANFDDILFDDGMTLPESAAAKLEKEPVSDLLLEEELEELFDEDFFTEPEFSPDSEENTEG